MKRILFLFALICLAFTSCQKVVDADNLLDTKERVSIIGYLAPSDTILRVAVTKALPTIGTPIQWSTEGNFPEEFLIRNANVSIANANGAIAELSYAEEINAYIADAANLAIEVGNDYFLSVIVDGQEYNASCTIPKPIETITQNITFRPNESGEEVANVTLSFADFLNEDNYYILGGFYEATFDDPEFGPFITNYSLFFDEDEFLTDNINDGGILNGTSEVFVNNSDFITEATITLQVANVEEVLFQHLRTNSINGNTEGNPFVEFAIAPNMFLDDGAIGIFAGYTLTEKVILLE